MKWTTGLTAPALVLLATGASHADRKTETDVRRSVVRIHATQRAPDLFKPWMKQDPREISGTGVVLEGGRILTNAHLVVYAKHVYVQPYLSSDKLTATVERLAPGIDLALLRLEDRGLAENLPPLRRAADLPEDKDAVSVYGYPVGGSSLAVTRGAVARIGYGAYAYGELGLQIQIDAALNPGNSGGPALVKDRMVGLVIGTSTEGQNIGFVIPNEEIDHFLQNGKGGKPRIADDLQVLQNDALRGKLNLARGTRGILVRAPASSEPSYPLKKGDVITRIGTYEVDNDGMVSVKDNLRLSFAYVVPRLARGGRVPVTLLRQGQARVIDLPVARNRRSLIRPLQGEYPPYFVYGPLVFSPATTSLARLLSPQLPPGSPLLARWTDEVAFDGEELVVVTATLPHRIAKGYGDPTGQVVGQVNGTRIRNLRHLVQTLRDVTGPYAEIDFPEKYVETLVLDRKEVLAAMEDILSDNNIGHPCSADLRGVWGAGK
jgi:S1-C subfamily serine protease